MKLCKKCNQSKPKSNFSKGKKYADGLFPWCKDCMRDYQKNWYQHNKENHKAKSVMWRKNNPEKAKIIDRRWNADNKEKVSIRYKAWRQKNRGYDCFRVSMRRADKLQATPLWADQDKIREIYNFARYLSDRDGEEYHVDHIVPLNGSNACGLHWEGNLQAIPARHNLMMGNRIWPDMWTIHDIKPKRIDQAQRQGKLFP